MTKEATETKFEIMPNGIVFTEVVTVFSDDNGNEVARSNPHRTPYKTGDGKIIDGINTALAAANSDLNSENSSLKNAAVEASKANV